MFITRTCLIRNFSVLDGDVEIFRSEAKSLDEFADAAFVALAVNYPKFHKMDRLGKLGFLAAEVLLRNLPHASGYSTDQIALVLANANSSLDTDRRFAGTLKTIPSPALFVYTLPNIVAGEICIRHGLRGENAFFVLPGFDPTVLADYTEVILSTDKTQCCITGWVEVVGEQHDVFLYLTEKKTAAGAMLHSAGQLQQIYTATYGKIDGGSEKADH